MPVYESLHVSYFDKNAQFLSSPVCRVSMFKWRQLSLKNPYAATPREHAPSVTDGPSSSTGSVTYTIGGL